MGGGGGMARGAEGCAWVQGWGARAGRAARACGVSAAVPRAGETPQQAISQIKGGGARQGSAAGKAAGLHLGQGGQGRLVEVGAHRSTACDEKS